MIPEDKENDQKAPEANDQIVKSSETAPPESSELEDNDAQKAGLPEIDLKKFIGCGG